MDEQKEAWPPAPKGLIAPALPSDVPRPSARLQVALGLVIGIIFVPVFYRFLLSMPHRGFIPSQAFVGAALFVALTLSALARHRFVTFSITFAVVSAIMAGLALLILELPSALGPATPL